MRKSEQFRDSLSVGAQLRECGVVTVRAVVVGVAVAFALGACTLQRSYAFVIELAESDRAHAAELPVEIASRLSCRFEQTRQPGSSSAEKRACRPADVEHPFVEFRLEKAGGRLVVTAFEFHEQGPVRPASRL